MAISRFRASLHSTARIRCAISGGPLRAARQRRLQNQCRARQRADRCARVGDGSIGGARRNVPGRRRHSRPSPAMSLLRRPHDHRRNLRVRWHAPRPTIVQRRRQNRDAMTTLTAALHYPPAGVSRSRRRTDFIPAPAKADAKPPIVPKSLRRVQQRRPILDRGRQSAVNNAGQLITRRSSCPTKSP